MKMKLYSGRRDRNGLCVVHVIERDGDSRLLDPRFDLHRHSPTFFEWGYGGSGPAQLALALIADALGDDAVALRLHQTFKWRVVARLPRPAWRLTQKEIVTLTGECLIERTRHHG